MHRKKCVVCFGLDLIPLELWRKDLTTRYRALSVQHLDALHECIADQHVDALLICHTVPEEECLPALGMARTARDPIEKVLLVSTGGEPYLPVSTIRVNEGPQKLLDKLSDLLGEKRLLMDHGQGDPTVLFRIVMYFAF